MSLPRYSPAIFHIRFTIWRRTFCCEKLSPIKPLCADRIRTFLWSVSSSTINSKIGHPLNSHSHRSSSSRSEGKYKFANPSKTPQDSQPSVSFPCWRCISAPVAPVGKVLFRQYSRYLGHGVELFLGSRVVPAVGRGHEEVTSASQLMPPACVSLRQTQTKQPIDLQALPQVKTRQIGDISPLLNFTVVSHVHSCQDKHCKIAES